MLLRSRPATVADLLADRDRLAFAYGGDGACLAEAWAGMLPLPSVWSLTVEDAESGQVVYHSMTAFVSEGFASRLVAEGAPFVGAQVVRRFLEAGDEPLGTAGLATALAGEGLCAVNLHSVCPQAPPGAHVAPELGEYVAARNFEAMRGYRFRAWLREAYDPAAAQSYAAGGWNLRANRGAAVPSLARPHLLGIDREEAMAATGARMAAMFVERPRRLGLRSFHRELLGPALRGLSDEEIAAGLRVSLSAVKKRWVATYGHVDERLPGLLPFDADRRGRGVERRRHLLAFLRERPEEMCPLPD